MLIASLPPLQDKKSKLQKPGVGIENTKPLDKFAARIQANLEQIEVRTPARGSCLMMDALPGIAVLGAISCGHGCVLSHGPACSHPSMPSCFCAITRPRFVPHTAWRTTRSGLTSRFPTNAASRQDECLKLQLFGLPAPLLEQVHGDTISSARPCQRPPSRSESSLSS